MRSSRTRLKSSGSSRGRATTSAISASTGPRKRESVVTDSAVTGVRLARYTLVFGDMFGGNAFQLTLFLVADLVAGQPVLPAEGKANAWIGCVGLLMTAVFVSGIVLRPQRRHLGLGLDSWIALLIYALGIWGLVVVSG